MTARSTKIELLGENTQSQIEFTRKSISGFNDDLSPIIREITSDPKEYLEGNSKKATLGALQKAVTQTSADGINVSLKEVGGAVEVSEIPYVSGALGFVQSLAVTLNTTQTLLTSTKALLETLNVLAVNVDDAVYLLVKSTLTEILEFITLLSPRIGVHTLVIPPSPPGTRKSTDALDTQILESYREMASSIRDTLEDTGTLALRDRDYFSKAYNTAVGTQGLKDLVLKSIDDKYDPNRPYARSTISLKNTGNSAGVILTAGGSATSVNTIYKNWCKVFGFSLPIDTSTPSPSIKKLSYTKEITGESYNINVDFNLKGHKYVTHQPAVVLPIKYRIFVYQGDHISEPHLTEHIWSLPLTNAGLLQAGTLSTVAGLFTFSYAIIEGVFDTPFTDISSTTSKAVSNPVVQAYYQKATFSESVRTPLLGTYKVVVSVRSEDPTVPLGTSTLVDNSTSRNITLEAKKSSASKAAPPNWYGGSLELPQIKYLEGKINEVSILIKSLTERYVSNYLDSGIQVLQGYLDLITRIRSLLPAIISTLELIETFRVGGYASMFKADSGVSGLKKAVEEHFQTMDPHAGDTMAALLIVGESDLPSDLEILNTLLNMVLGVDVSVGTKKTSCADVPIGASGPGFSLPDQAIGNLPPELEC